MGRAPNGDESTALEINPHLKALRRRSTDGEISAALKRVASAQQVVFLLDSHPGLQRAHVLFALGQLARLSARPHVSGGTYPFIAATVKHLL